MDQKQKAEDLFLYTEKTQQQIAAELGISPRTLYRWIRQGRWQQLKAATRLMPSVLVENIYAQLDDINYSISQRDRGERHPTKDESLTINRLTNCIGKVQKQTSQGQNIQFMMSFIDWIQTQNDELAKTLTEYGSAYIKGTEVQGFHPYDIEYINNSPFEGGRGDVEAWEGSSVQEHDNQLELPFPPIETGHDSDIQNQTQNPSQETVNQSPIPENPLSEMSENNLPQYRTQEEAPPLFLGEVPEGGRGQLAQDSTPNQGRWANEPPTEDPPDFSDPNLLVKEYMRQKGLPVDEDIQLYSIGGKVFTMRIDKNKKKKRN